MAARLRSHLPAIAGAALCLAVLAWLGLIDFAWSDYDLEAAPAFRALLEGRVTDFLAASPSYGGSMVLRAPFAAAPAVWGGGELAAFRAGSLVCLVAVAVLGVWLVAQMRALGRPVLWRAVVLGACAASPIALRALEIGHPEELLGGTLCVAAVLAAGRRRAGWAAVLLGLAIATKAWGVLAIGPVLLLVDGQRLRTLAVAAGVCAAVLAPLVAAHPRSFTAKAQDAARTGTLFEAQQAWWFLGEERSRVRGGEREFKRFAPAWIERVTHPLIALLALPLTALLWRVRRGRVGPGDALLLLALLLHLRCLLDTWNVVYYAAPLLLAVAAWEALYARRAPVFSLLGALAVWISFEELPGRRTLDAQAAVYLAWAIPAAVLLAVRIYGPRTSVQPSAVALSPFGSPVDAPAVRV